MLHRVVEEIGENRISNHGIEITKEYLHFLIDFYLKNGFSIASINELESILSSKNKKRSVIFTFDDGYLDNYTLALPVFQQYNIPFAVYVPLDFIKRKQFGWWYLIEDLIRTKSSIQLKGNDGKVQNVYDENLDSETNFSQLRTFIQKNPCAIADLIDKSPVDVQKYYDLFLTEKTINGIFN
jgi:peptidoglycan/xylan/chitin deacetylase (PgdA/CDA1 family)